MNIEEHMRKAFEEGKFNDLPGKGKPLNLDENPHADPEWRLALHMLQSSGFTLPWIETRQEIEQSLTQARSDLQRAWECRSASPASGRPPAQVESEWKRALERFGEQAAAINKRILSYNLEVPSDRFQRAPVNAAREIEKVTSSRA